MGFRKAYSSYEKTASAQLKTSLCAISSVLVITDGTNAATCAAYNVKDSGDAAAGNKIGEWIVTGAQGYGGRNWSFPVQLNEGLYVTISGTGASFIAEWLE